MKEIKYADLFCGLGAFHTAFNRYNLKSSDKKYTCVLACDINEGVRKIYEENYGLKPEGDIKKLKSIPDFGILCSGFPCQSYSISGNKKGFEDKKNGDLFFEVLNIVDKKQPSKIIMENVKNLHTIHDGKEFKIIKDELEKRNYYVSYKVIDSKYYNSPQSRQRIYIICDKQKPYVFRDIKKSLVPVSSIIDRCITTYFDYEDKYKLERCKGKSMMKFKLINKETGKGGRQGERVYDLESCGPTICASSGGPGAKTGLYDFDGKIRTLTVKESLKMFSFDETYKYKGIISDNTMLSYLGNSIVVNVLEQLIKDL